MKRIAIFITTYNRPNLLLSLLKDIYREARGFDLNLLIIDDHSSEDYIAVKYYLQERFAGRYKFIENPVNHGKQFYWKTITNGFQYMASVDFEYFILLQDDLRLMASFFKKAISAFDSILDDQKACLSIRTELSRVMTPCWTNYVPHYVNFPGIECIRTGWVDMLFISDKRFFTILNYQIFPIDNRWSSNKNLSSGVGMQISRRLISQGHSIYALKRSLVIHDHHPSLMHPLLRQDTKLITNHNMDKITATMATMPGREESLKEVITSIIDQVDELRIYTNNLHQVPVNLHNKKIKWLFSKDHAGDIGDAGKFYSIDDIQGYHLTIDDDLIYPPDYVARLISAIEHYERRCTISLHGRSFPPGKISSYYRSATGCYSCLRSVARDVFVHVVGTGVLAYHTDTVRVPFETFQAANMADVWFSKYCQEKKVPRLVLKHAGGWVKDSPYYDQATSIYFNNCNDDTLQTQVMNSIVWTLP
jgi:glycosyltransferase involved in cell wall biosynthesis